MANLFLALADIHGEAELLTRILSKNPCVQAAFIAGDLTHFGKEKEAARILSILSVSSPHEFFFVAGNCDSLEAQLEFSRHINFIDKRAKAFQDQQKNILTLIGAGGGLLHTGLTPFELSEEELEANLNSALTESNTKSISRSLIVLTHTPPFGTYADMRLSRHLGSTSYEAFLYEHEPLMWICGHIHEGRSAHYEGNTLVVNPGPAAQGKYALIAIERIRGELCASADLKAI